MQSLRFFVVVIATVAYFVHERAGRDARGRRARDERNRIRGAAEDRPGLGAK